MEPFVGRDRLLRRYGMDIAKIRELVELVAGSGVAELEIETKEMNLRIRSGHVADPDAQAVNPIPAPAANPAAAPVVPVSVPAPAEAGLCAVHSPIVGTFYRAASPDAPPFVEVGQRVAAGDPLCIVEAMKVMNEIEAEFAGVVREICAEDAQPVEAEAVLFRVEPD